MAWLQQDRERHQRIMASVPDGAQVDLSLLRLPEKALMFPAVPEGDADIDLAKPRNPRNFSKEFVAKPISSGLAA